MPGEGEEDANLRLADALEEVADDNLRPYQREHQYADAHTTRGDSYQLVVIGKHGGHGMREEFADKEPARSDAHAREDAQLQCSPHAVHLQRTEVVTHDGLHAHRKSQYNHDVKREQPVDDAIRTNRHVAPVPLQRIVDDDDNDAGTHVHQKRRHADGEDTQDDALPQLPEVGAEAHEAVLVHEVLHHPHHADELRNDRCHCRPAYAPSEVEDEDGGEDDVAHYGDHRREHRLLGVARGAHDVVEAYHDVGNRRAGQDYLHELPRIGQRVRAGTEEAQYVVQKHEGQSAEDDGVDEAEHERVAQHFGGAFQVFLPEADGRYSGAARRHQRAEGNDEVHQRKRDGKSGNAQSTHAVADEDAVDDVVERGDCHPDDGGDGVLQEQLADGLGAEYVRVVVHKIDV